MRPDCQIGKGLSDCDRQLVVRGHSVEESLNLRWSSYGFREAFPADVAVQASGDGKGRTLDSSE